MAEAKRKETKLARKSPRYSEREIEVGLLAVAAANRNLNEASRTLASGGLKIDPRTLGRWIEKEAERYEVLRLKVLPEIRAEAAEDYRRLSKRQRDLAIRMLDRLDKEVGDVPIRDLPRSLKESILGSAISTDKSEALTGHATQIVEHRDVGQIVKALASKGVEVEVVDSTAEELPPPELEAA